MSTAIRLAHAIRNADLHDLNERIQVTQAYLSGLRRARDRVLSLIEAACVVDETDCRSKPMERLLADARRSIDPSTSQLFPDQAPREIARYYDDGNPNQFDAGGEA